jgi:arylsulfatase A-like enzyme
MKNITVIKFIILLVFAACSIKGSCQDKQPNILFILVDDQRNDVLSCAGHPIVETPTIDKLASDGVRFTNAFVTTSICAASRASILTGLYESKHNFTFGKPALKTEYIQSSYPYLLKKAGYTTGFVGKLGVKIENKDSLLKEMFDYCNISKKSTPYFIEQEDGSRRHSAEIKGDQAVEFIEQQSADKPFCLSLNFNAVHAVDGNKTPGNEGHYPYPATVANLYEDIEMPLPKLSDPEIFDNHPEFLKRSMNRVRYFWRWDTDEKYQINMKAYYRMISGYDNVVKRVLESLKEKGLDKNTVIIYSADNGYYMGNRGFAGKWSHYEESLRVPMIIYDPRTPEKQTEIVSDKMALNIDIPSTILDYAGISKPQVYQGESLLPIMKDEKVENWRKSFFCEHKMGNKQIPKYIGLRGEQYVYANYYEQEPAYEFLHDLKNDPDQLVNLAGNPKYKELLSTMRKECKSLEIELKR